MNTTYRDDAAPEAKRDRKSIWIRGGFMLFFLLAFSIAQTLLVVLAVIQFLSLLLAGRANAFLADFGRSLGTWLQQMVAFEAGVTEDMPFPWAPWPKPL